MAANNLLLKTVNTKVGFIGAGNLAAHMVKGLINSGEHPTFSALAGYPYSTSEGSSCPSSFQHIDIRTQIGKCGCHRVAD